MTFTIFVFAYELKNQSASSGSSVFTLKTMDSIEMFFQKKNSLRIYDLYRGSVRECSQVSKLVRDYTD